MKEKGTYVLQWKSGRTDVYMYNRLHRFFFWGYTGFLLPFYDINMEKSEFKLIDLIKYVVKWPAIRELK